MSHHPHIGRESWIRRWDINTLLFVILTVWILVALLGMIWITANLYGGSPDGQVQQVPTGQADRSPGVREESTSESLLWRRSWQGGLETTQGDH